MEACDPPNVVGALDGDLHERAIQSSTVTGYVLAGSVAASGEVVPSGIGTGHVAVGGGQEPREDEATPDRPALPRLPSSCW